MQHSRRSRHKKKQAEEIKAPSASIIIFMWQSVVIDFMLKYEQFPLNEY